MFGVCEGPGCPAAGWAGGGSVVAWEREVDVDWILLGGADGGAGGQCVRKSSNCSGFSVGVI